MKNILLVCLILSVGCSGALVSLATASGNNQSDHTPTDTMLEFSLLRLKESVQKTAQKNQRLSFENDMLREGIRDLEKKKKFLFAKKAELSGRSDVHRFEKDIQFTKVLDPAGRKQRVQKLIAIFQNDIGRLEDQIQVLDGQLGGGGFHSHKRMLLERKEKSRKILLKSEKQFDSLEKKSLGAKGQIKELKELQEGLVREIEMLQNRARRL
jgi:hypothetical protein